MARDLAYLRSEVRSRLIEPTARYFSAAEIDRWINLGYADFISQTEWTEKLYAIPVTANQYVYSLPTETLKVNMMTWQDKYLIYPENDQHKFFAYMGLANTSKNKRPVIYLLYPWDKSIRLWAIPNTTSKTTLINDAAGITSTATSITVDSTTDFPTNGRITIDNEQILYYNTSATQFLQCVRGDGFTTGATHADNATVNYAELNIYIHYVPPDLSAATDEPRVPEAYREALVLYAQHIGLQKRERYIDAGRALEMYTLQVQRAKAERTIQNLDQYYSIQDDSEAWY